tara:strand:- start:476 stop:718 length:243 start_codon:yes stop_codon:yes gene_type:complete
MANLGSQEHYIKILNRKQQIRDRLAYVIKEYKNDIRTWVSSSEDQDHIQHELGYIKALYFALGRESCKQLTWIEKWEERI